MNYYELLEVSPNASPEVVRAAYKSLMQRHHPDKNPAGGGVAAERAALIARAYEVLSNPAAREAYDAQLRRERAAAAPPAAGGPARRPYAPASHGRAAASPYAPFALRAGVFLVVAAGLLVLLKQVLRPPVPQVVATAPAPAPAPQPPARSPGTDVPGANGTPAAPGAPAALLPPASSSTPAPTAAPARASKPPPAISLLDTDMHVLLVRRVRLDGSAVPGEDDDDGAPFHEIVIPAIRVQVGSIEGERFAASLADKDIRADLALKLNNQLGQQLRFRRLRVEGDAYLARLVRDILRDLTGTRELLAPPGAPADDASDTSRYGIVSVSLPDGYFVRQ